jgi:flagellum-specific peptidoglycan hydrolase FlgJ
MSKKLKKNWQRGLMLLLVNVMLASPTVAYGSVPSYQALPHENLSVGRNSHAYNPAQGQLSEAEKEAFVDEVTTYAKSAEKQWHVPAEAIIGMAIKESGYGFTRVAVNANNIFSMKIYSVNPSGAWQLKGQPFEGDNKPSLKEVTAANHGNDRIVFKEWLREDNWYRNFDSREEAVEYLAGTLLQNSRYRPALDRYYARVAASWPADAAASQYVYDVAAAGYCSWGPVYYRQEVTKFMDMWDLY